MTQAEDRWIVLDRTLTTLQQKRETAEAERETFYRLGLFEAASKYSERLLVLESQIKEVESEIVKFFQ